MTMLSATDQAHYDALAAAVAEHDSLVVAFSGGADSSLLAYVANRELGPERVLCTTAVSASLAGDERDDARALALEWGLRHLEVDTNELADARYVANDADRCYFCKLELMGVLGPIAASTGAVVALGVNLDDLGDIRPGQKAARDHGGVFPLVSAGLDKSAVRSLSKGLGLRTWDKPQAACLSSRIPHGTPVTITTLGRVERAEQALRRLGFKDLRVRHYGESARIELGVDELARAFEQREAISAAVHDAGYDYVTLDLDGFRSGNLARTHAAQQQGARR